MNENRMSESVNNITPAKSFRVDDILGINNSRLTLDKIDKPYYNNSMNTCKTYDDSSASYIKPNFSYPYHNTESYPSILNPIPYQQLHFPNYHEKYSNISFSPNYGKFCI